MSDLILQLKGKNMTYRICSATIHRQSRPLHDLLIFPLSKKCRNKTLSIPILLDLRFRKSNWALHQISKCLEMFSSNSLKPSSRNPSRDPFHCQPSLSIDLTTTANRIGLTSRYQINKPRPWNNGVRELFQCVICETNKWIFAVGLDIIPIGDIQYERPSCTAK